MYSRYDQMLSLPARLPLPITPSKQTQNKKKMENQGKIKDCLELADSSPSPQRPTMPEPWPSVMV